MRPLEEFLKLNPQQRKGTSNRPIVEKGKYPGGKRETYDSSTLNETTITEYDKDNNIVEQTEISRHPNGKARRISTTVYYTDAKKKTGSPQEKTETSAYFDDRGNVIVTTRTEKDKSGNCTSDKSDEWKYDEQGRQIEHTIKENDPNSFSKGSTGTRETTKYSGDKDTKGTTTKEKVRRNERTGAWETEFGIPLEKPKQQQEPPACEPQSPPKPGERTDEIMINYPRVELFAGYSFTSEDGDSENTNLHGWNTSVAINLNEHVAVRADVSGFYRSEGNTHISKHLFVFGPQFSYRPNSRVRVFARPLFGLAHFKAETDLPGLPTPISFSENAFAMAFGGGLDLRVNNHLMVRLGQFDYQPTFFGDTRQDNFRFSTGLVFTFGGGSGNSNDVGEDESEELKKFRAARRKAEEDRKLKDKAKEELDEAEEEGIRSMSPLGKTEWEQANAELEEAKTKAAQARNASIEADGEANALKTPEASLKAQSARLAKVRADLKVDQANEQAEKKKTEAMTPEAREKYIKARNEYREKNAEFERSSKAAMEAQEAWEKTR